MISLEICYVAELDWALVRLGLPLILELRARYEGKEPPPALPFGLSIPRYLEYFRHVIAESNLSGRDVSGDILAKASSAWRLENAWREAQAPSKSELVLTFPGDATASCPLDVLPPTYWRRHTLRPAGQRLRVRRAQVVLDGRSCRIGSLREENLDLTGLTFPPLDTSIVALMDPGASYARPGSESAVAAALDHALRLHSDKAAGPSGRELLNMLAQAYEASALPITRPLDAIEHAPTIPLLALDAEWGVIMRDPAVLACEALEGRARRPVLVLAADGARLLAGVFEGDAGFPDSAWVCRDAQTFDRLVEDEKLLMFGAHAEAEAAAAKTRALIGEGFVAAIDVAACRSRIAPLARPIGHSSSWTAVYLEGLRNELALTNEQALEPGSSDGDRAGRLTCLDDPAELFVAVSCRLPDGSTRNALSTPDRVGWLEQSLLQGQRRIVILGDGGSGKSYLTRRLAGNMADRLQLGNSLPIPIWFPLRTLSAAESLLDAIAQASQLGTADNLKRLASTTPLLIILDALDESGREYSGPQQLRALLDPVCELPGCSVLLTTRAAILPGALEEFLPQFEIAELQGWSEQDLLDYLRACEQKGLFFSQGPSAFHSFVLGSSNLRDLARTPLFARMIVETRDEIQANGDVRDELDLYRRYTRSCLARRLSKVSDSEHPFHRRPTRLDIAEAGRATAEIARLMFETGKSAMPASELVRTLSISLPERGIDDYRHFLAEDVLVHGLLGPDNAGRGDRKFRFGHISIHHYFLAERVYPELARALAEGKLPGIIALRPLLPSVLKFIVDIGASGEPGPWLKEPVALPASEMRTRLKALVQSDHANRRQLLGMDRSTRQASPAIALRNAVLLHLGGGGDLTDADLSDLDFTGADLSRSVLQGSNLEGVRFDGGNLRDADLSGCSLTQAHLCDVDVTGTDFSDVDFSYCELKGLRVDASRRHPTICNARNLDKLLVDRDSRATLQFLTRCLADCMQPSSWQPEARRALIEALSRIDIA